MRYETFTKVKFMTERHAMYLTGRIARDALSDVHDEIREIISIEREQSNRDRSFSAITSDTRRDCNRWLNLNFIRFSCFNIKFCKLNDALKPSSVGKRLRNVLACHYTSFHSFPQRI